MNFIVLASALRSSGALSIYNQFIHHLSDFICKDKYFIFVDPNVPRPKINGVTYICDENHSWLHRIYWDCFGVNIWMKKNDIQPDAIISLQNIGVKTSIRQIIYYHQSLPFYDNKWSFFRSNERMMWLYKYVYPLFVSLSLTSKTDVVVQIPFIKKCFISRFGVSEDKVHVMFPDVEKIERDKIEACTLSENYYHFVYPATPNPYKEHKTLCLALYKIRTINKALYNKIKIHFTISNGESKMLEKYIFDLELKNVIQLHGRMSHGKLLSLYKSCDGLLFPSTIETLGLPLLEAAAFGLPIVASNLDYAHEVMGDYEGVKYVDSYDYDSWAEAIVDLCESKKRYKPIQYNESTWGNFFNLIKGNHKQ